MKKMPKLFAALFVAATFIFVGCKKDNTTPVTPDTPVSFNKTTWAGHLEGTQSYNMVPITFEYDVTIEFMDSEKGKMLHNMVAYVSGSPESARTENSTEEFTYTFTNDKVTMRCTSGGTYVGNYDKNAKTLTVDLNDLEMMGRVGTDVMVFSKK